MTTLHPAPPRQSVSVSRSLMVAVSFKGLVVPRYQDFTDIELGVAELALIEALTHTSGRDVSEIVRDVAGRSGSSVASLEALIAALDDRALLTHSAATAPNPAEPAPTSPVELPLSETVQWVLVASIVFRLADGGFEHLDHDGRRDALLTAAELHAVSAFRLPTSLPGAYASHVEGAGGLALDRVAFDRVVERLASTRVLQEYDPANPLHAGHNNDIDELRAMITRKFNVIRGLERDVQAHEASEREREARTSTTRIRIVPVAGSDSYWNTPPLALGYLVSYAKVHRDGALEDRYQFHPRWVSDREQLRDVARDPGIFIFSNYIWNHAENLELSALVKATNSANITVHGGPDTPKYEGDNQKYFADNAHVDITVRGEGEETFAEILDALDRSSLSSGDLSSLADVRGLSYRTASGPVQTPDRDRMSDLNVIPSPYLTGLFDTFANDGATGVVLETNRGCPYGCTFCDWGSATASRIRKFDLDRVLAELEWCATHGISYVGLADANYGIFERDIEIARKAAELKSTYGFPKMFGTNYAKNTVKHLRPIIEVLAEADIITEGVVSLQSMDSDTLLTIRRSNIKVEKYDDLQAEFRRSKLPLSVDLMMGLPGATAASFRNDLQECADREVRVRVYPTTMLPNSPMNDPDYRRENKIVAAVGEILSETASYTRQEWEKMVRLRRVYLVGQRFAALRYVALYVRSEAGMGEVAFFERLLDDTIADPERWPTISFVLNATPELMAPPCSWRPFVDELGRYLIEVLGIPDDRALATVLEVQHAHLPAVGRPFPITLVLDHDFTAFYREVLATKESGHRHDWQESAPSLRSFEPGTMVLADKHDICRTALGGTIDSLSQYMTGWELASPVSRA